MDYYFFIPMQGTVDFSGDLRDAVIEAMRISNGRRVDIYPRFGSNLRPVAVVNPDGTVESIYRIIDKHGNTICKGLS